VVLPKTSRHDHLSIRSSYPARPAPATYLRPIFSSHHLPRIATYPRPILSPLTSPRLTFPTHSHSHHIPTMVSLPIIDLKGCLGTRAKVDIQDRISMRISLGITIRLATQAASVDPETYRPADEVMRKTYGLTIVTDTWNSTSWSPRRHRSGRGRVRR